MKTFTELFLLIIILLLSTKTYGNNIHLYHEPVTYNSSSYKIFAIPKHSYLLSIDNLNAIFGRLDKPEIMFLDLETEEVKIESIPIIPRVSLRLGENSFAILGFEQAKRSLAKGFPTKKFIILNNKKHRTCELIEPIFVLQGVKYKNAGLILDDQSANTIVFVHTDDIINNACYDEPEDKQPEIREQIHFTRLSSLDIGPYDIELLSDSYLAVSYLNSSYCDVFNLESDDLFDRVRSRAYNKNLSLSSFQSKQNYNYLMILDGNGYEINLFRVSNETKENAFHRAEFTGAVPVEFDFDFEKQQDNIRDINVAFEVLDNKTVWLGYKKKLMIFRIEQGQSDNQPKETLKLLKVKTLPLESIKRILFFNNNQQVAFSSPDEGIVLTFTISELISQ